MLGLENPSDAQRKYFGPEPSLRHAKACNGVPVDGRLLSLTQLKCSNGVLVHHVSNVMVIVAMFVTTKNPTVKTVSTKTMSMMTPMTTVLHRVLEIDWSNTGQISPSPL